MLRTETGAADSHSAMPRDTGIFERTGRSARRRASAEAGPPPGGDEVVVEVAGSVPGFTQAQLSAYLAREMQGAAGQPWRFTSGSARAAANRIVWSFKTLREVWKGGSHSGFPSPCHSRTYLSTEAKLYLGGAFQMTMSTQPTVYQGTADSDLANTVHSVAHAMFIESRP